MNIYFFDTSALINDVDLLNKVYGLIIIHNIVLDELDNKTNKNGSVGKNARCVMDKLFQISKHGDIHKGINIGNGVVIKLDNTKPNTDKLSFGLDESKNDNLLLAIYNEIYEKHKNDNVYFYTGDKCLSIKIENGIVNYIGKNIEHKNKKQNFRKDTKIQRDMAHH